MDNFSSPLCSTALLLLTLSAPGLAIADQRTDSGLYLSAGIGKTQVDSNLSLKDDNGIIPRIAAGWQLTPHFGVEAAYHNFSETEDPFGTLSKWDISGASVAGTLRLPLTSKLAVFSKLGRMWWSTDLSDTNCSRGPAGCSTTKYDISEANYFLGVGLGYELTDMLELELEYENIDFDFNDRNLDIFNNETSVIALSLKLKL